MPFGKLTISLQKQWMEANQERIYNETIRMEKKSEADLIEWKRIGTFGHGRWAEPLKDGYMWMYAYEGRRINCHITREKLGQRDPTDDEVIVHRTPSGEYENFWKRTQVKIPQPPVIDTPYLLPIDTYIAMHIYLHKKGFTVTKDLVNEIINGILDEREEQKRKHDEQQKKALNEAQQKKTYPVGWQVVKIPDAIDMYVREYMTYELPGKHTFTYRVNMKKGGRLDGLDILVDTHQKTGNEQIRMCPLHKCYYYTHNGFRGETYIQDKNLVTILSNFYDELKRTMRND